MPRREVNLPPVLAKYASRVGYVQQVSEHEWSSSCPSCGGEQHAGGEWPDRCRWFLDGNPPKPRGWCRRCGSIFWPDESKTLAPDELKAWQQEQRKREEARKRSAERALANLRESALWERYHESLRESEQGRGYWRRRGVPQGMQDFWELGWDAEHRFGSHVTATATIPLRAADWQVLNVKHRLVDPGDCGRYRYQLRGQAQPMFLCNPDVPMTNHVIAIEGEIKAMATFAKLDDAKMVMVGLPGTHPSERIIETLAGADRVTLVMDPGAKRDGLRIARKIGLAKVWLLETPVKIDDGIVDLGLEAIDIRRLLRGALRVADFVRK